MMSARSSHALVVLNKTFYSIGGVSSTGNSLKSCEKLKIDN